MQRVLIVREDGAAFLQEVEQISPDEHREGGAQLAPDDVVDGKKVRDWPVGVFTVKSVISTGLESRISDWNADTLESENET